MKFKYDRTKIPDKPVVNMWTPLRLRVDENYPFVPRGRAFRIASGALHRLAGAVLPLFNRLMFGLQVEGREHLLGIPGGAVTVCNHVHILDCSMVASASGLKKRMLFPTLKSNLEIPFIRHLVRLLGGIPIPTSTKAFGRFCKVVKDSLRQGDWVHLYPEGMLAPYFDGVRPFHRGAFMFAHDCGVPVVPFVIHYRESASRWRKGRLLLNMTILPPSL